MLSAKSFLVDRSMARHASKVRYRKQVFYVPSMRVHEPLSVAGAHGIAPRGFPYMALTEA